MSATTSTSSAIGIVGAGLAGLTTAYRLYQAGIRTVIFEATNRVGGRAYTLTFPNGQICEVGGEYIDTNHDNIISLVQEVGLELVTAIPNSLPEKYMVVDYSQSSQPLVDYTSAEVFADYQTIFPKLSADADAAWPGDEFKPNKANRSLDKINMDTYINDVCEPLGGANSKFAQLLKTAYTTEYGLEPILQSCLNLLFLIGFGTIDKFSMFGPSDEVYNIKGGTQALPNRLRDILLASGLCEINLGTPVTKIARTSKGKYRLSTESRCFTYDQIVMTIPYQMYSRVDYTNAHFSNLKQYIIRNLKLGFNSKINMQFKRPYWLSQGYNGLCNATNNPPVNNPLAERQLQQTWDVAADQTGSTAILCNYTGGSVAKTITTSIIPSGNCNADLKIASENFLTQLEEVFPGARANFQYDNPANIQNVMSVNWKQMPWTQGAYTCYTVGQYSGGTGNVVENGMASPPGSVVPFAGLEALSEPQDLPPGQRVCHFAGESCNLNTQGFLEAAILTGNEAASKVIKLYRAPREIQQSPPTTASFIQLPTYDNNRTNLDSVTIKQKKPYRHINH